MNLNIAVIGGNITADPELKYTPKGTAVVQFSVAINRRWKDDSGEVREEVSFFNCQGWGKTAEAIGQYLRKGDPILIDGRLKQESWEDKQSGQKRSRVIVVINSFQFVGQKREDRDERPPVQRQTRPPAAGASQPELAEGGNPDYSDDVPF